MAHLNIVVVLLRTYQVISAILITVFVACLMRGLKGGLTNTTAGVAFDMAAATAAVALFMSLLVTVIRCSAAPRRKSLVVAMILDGFMTALSFSSAVVLTCELEIHDCRQLDIPALKSACCAIQGTIACMWIMFSCFLVTTFLSFKEYRNS